MRISRQKSSVGDRRLGHELRVGVSGGAMVRVAANSVNGHREAGSRIIVKDRRDGSGAWNAGGGCGCSPQQSPRVGRQTSREARCQRDGEQAQDTGRMGRRWSCSVGIGALRLLGNASCRLLIERSGEEGPTVLSASEDGRSVDHGLWRNDKPRSRLLVKNERTANRGTTTTGRLSVENDSRWADRSCRRILVKDAGKR